MVTLISRCAPRILHPFLDLFHIYVRKRRVHPALRSYNRDMELSSDLCYQALRARDRRFDGHFFVGVTSTGIYCRPVCTARLPKRQNCTFHRSAAAAERAGFRPCLRCRPELAPGNARVDAVGRLAAAAADRIEEGALSEGGLEELAAELGVSGRHLRRVIEQEFGVTPIELAQTSRLLLAKRLLTDTDLPVTEIAFASGFSSLRRFNALFRERYRLNPTGLRRTRGAGSAAGFLACEIGYCPPLDWDGLLDFLRPRLCRGVEAIDGGRFSRALAMCGHRGWVAVEPAAGREALRVEVSLSLAPALRAVLATVKRVFDLGARPRQIAEALGPLAAAHPGMRLPGSFDPFETAVRAILGQQVSVAGARTLAERFARAFGDPVQIPVQVGDSAAGALGTDSLLTHYTPTAERIAAADPSELAALGILPARARTIVLLSREIAEGRIALRPGRAAERTVAQLCALPGIGEWTANYVAMRALAWPDAFLPTDLGVRKALGDPGVKRILEIAEPWRPWRAYATMHLWRSLEERG